MLTLSATNITSLDSCTQVRVSTKDIFSVFSVSFFESSDSCRVEVNCISQQNVIRRHFTTEKCVWLIKCFFLRNVALSEYLSDRIISSS